MRALVISTKNHLRLALLASTIVSGIVSIIGLSSITPAKAGSGLLHLYIGVVEQAPASSAVVATDVVGSTSAGAAEGQAAKSLAPIGQKPCHMDAFSTVGLQSPSALPAAESLTIVRCERVLAQRDNLARRAKLSAAAFNDGDLANGLNTTQTTGLPLATGGVFLRAGFKGASQSQAISALLLKQGVQRVAVAYAQGGEWQDTAFQFGNEFAVSGGSVSASLPLEANRQDYSSEIGALSADGAEYLLIFAGDNTASALLNTALDTGAFDRFVLVEGLVSDPAFRDILLQTKDAAALDLPLREPAPQ